MSAAPSDFTSRCAKAAERFLQMVVVIDNQAEFDAPRTHPPQLAHMAQTTLSGSPAVPEVIPDPAVTPEEDISPAGSTGQSAAEQEVTSDAQVSGVAANVAETDGEERFGHELDAKALTDAFGDRNILCTIYRPAPGENMVERSGRIASHADVVIVDWILEHQSSSKAKEIIADILRRDNERNGRLRLIAVYTGQAGMPALARELFDYLTNSAGLSGLSLASEDEAVLLGPNARIVFLAKAGSRLGQSLGGVAVADVPGRLITEFTKLNTGILPSIALQSIAAIREATHHIVATFHSGLDAALVLHRCLLPSPEDAVPFAVELVAEELGEILRLEDIGGGFAGIDATKEWLQMARPEGANLKIGQNIVTHAQLHHFLEKGKSGSEHANIPGAGGKKAQGTLGEILYGEPGTAKSRCLELSRISILKREAYGRRSLPPLRPPALSLGTIVKPLPNEKGEMPGGLEAVTFLLCTQPVCDAVRINGQRRFPFQRAVRSDSPFNVVVKLQDKTEATLHVDGFPYMTEMFTFKCTPQVLGAVVAEVSGGRYVFRDVDGNQFEWLADLKELVAQFMVSSLGARFASVGMDLFEWLRQQAKT